MNPLYLEGYGNYGYSDQMSFNADMISLLDRGVFIATAHVRGGGELGARWWEDGKLLRIKNAIADYIACAEFLIKQGCTSKGMITAVGSSAGGIVVGAAVNERPELFKAALLMMPSVDLLSYAPYNNIKKQEYPPMLFRTSLMDTNESYAGALKMVAKLRATASGKKTFFIRTDDRKTHLGNTGIHDDLGFWSDNRAFILDQYGIEE
jgi:oligopeptidase B